MTIENTGAIEASNVETTDNSTNTMNGSVTESDQTMGESLADTVKKYKVKVDGEELEVDEDELLKGYQKHKGASKAFQEAAELRKQSEQLVKMLKDNKGRVDVFKKLGIDVRQFAEDYLLEQLEEERLSPDEKEKREIRRKLAEYESKDKAEKERLQKESLEQKLQQRYAIIQREIDTLVANQTELPKTNYVKERLIMYVDRMAGKPEYEHVKLADLLPLVKQDLIEQQKQLFAESDYDSLEKLYGPDIMKKFRQAEAKKLKQGTIHNTQKPNTKPNTQTKAKKTGMTMDEWKADLDAKFGKLN